MHAQDEEGSPAAQRASALVTAMQTLMDIECARRTRAAHARPLQLLRCRSQCAWCSHCAPRHMHGSGSKLQQHTACTSSHHSAPYFIPRHVSIEL